MTTPAPPVPKSLTDQILDAYLVRVGGDDEIDVVARAALRAAVVGNRVVDRETLLASVRASLEDAHT